MALELVTAPATEPLTIQEARDHIRVESTVDDEEIDRLIQASREWISGRDGWLGRQLITATWDMTLDAFPATDSIRLLLPPVQSITSISYVDINGATQTFSSANYSLSADLSVRPRVDLAYGASWPATRQVRDAVTIRYVAGYGNGVDVPAPIRSAMAILVGTWYENREATVVGMAANEVPFSVEAMLAPYRIIDLFA